VTAAMNKRIFVCTRFAVCPRHSVEEHAVHTRSIVRALTREGLEPIAPHLYLPNCLDDNDPAERQAGLAIGRSFLSTCGMLLLDMSDGVSSGMAGDLLFAIEHKIKVRQTWWPYEVVGGHRWFKYGVAPALPASLQQLYAWYDVYCSPTQKRAAL
jgi:hypothetical protein